jgi:hypothetical protein
MMLSTTQAAHLLGVSSARMRLLLSQGRIQGALKIGKFWAIPLVEGMPVVSRGRRGPQGRWRKRRRRPVTIIHVNQKVLRNNTKTGDRAPVIAVKQGSQNVYAQAVEIKGPCRVIYRPDKALSCGARVWIETHSVVEVIGQRLTGNSTSLALEFG